MPKRSNFKIHARLIPIFVGDGGLEMPRQRIAPPRLVYLTPLARLQRIQPDVSVIISTGYGEDTALRQIAGKSVAGVIQKPYTVRTLVLKVTDVLQPDRIPRGLTESVRTHRAAPAD